MTDDEWRGCCFLIDQGFKGDFADEQRQAYRVFLGHLDPTALAAALRKLVEDGQVFTPTPGEIRAAMKSLEQAPVPSWPEVWMWLQRGMRWACDRRVGEAGADERLTERCHPVVAAFARAEGGLSALARQPFFDEQYGALRIADLKKRWEEFVGVAQERLDRGLALDAAARREVGPARLDTVALLDSLRPERAELTAGDPPE